MHINHTKFIYCALFLASAFLTACGGGGGGAAAPATTYTIGGSISGLAGTVVLQNNGGDNLSISTGASTFTFSTALASGNYVVTVLTQPAGQNCTASSNTGTVSSANVNSVVVTCAVNSYSIGGTITGLTGTVVLQNNGANNLSRSADGSFTFTTPVASGAGYAVTVLTQPANQRCTVTSGSGTNVQANIASVVVSCVPAYTISANVSGYAPSIGLVLQNKLQSNGNDNLSIGGDGTSPFSKTLINGETYNVKVLIQPAAPALTCIATGVVPASGTVAISAVTVAITCATPIPQFAYVANYNSNDVSAYSIANGVLTAIGSNVPAGTGPSAITVVPSGKFAYVANLTSSDISAYTVHSTTGALTQVSCSGDITVCNGVNFLAGSNPSAVTVDPSGQFAYAANPNSNDISAYTINTTTGVLTQINCTGGITVCNGNNFLAGANPSSVTVDHTGQFAYVVNANDSNVSAYTIDAATGALTTIPCGGGAACDTANLFPDNFPAGAAPKSLDVDPTSKFAYVANKGEDSISAYTINPTTGALTQINCGGGGTCEIVVSAGANFLAGDEPSSIACDPTSKYVYVANRASTSTTYSISAYGINSTTGALTPIGSPLAAGVQPVSITVDLSGRYVYVANNGLDASSPPYYVSAYSINVDGSLSAISGSPFTAGTNPASVITTVIY